MNANGSTMALVEFLMARYRERAAWAKDALEEAQPFHDPKVKIEWEWAIHTYYETGGQGTRFIRSASPDSPHEVLADVQAKMTMLTDWIEAHSRTDSKGRPAHLHDPALSMVLTSHERWLRHLGTPFASHPDYHRRWRL